MSTRKLEAAITALCIGAMLATFVVIGAAWWLA